MTLVVVRYSVSAILIHSSDGGFMCEHGHEELAHWRKNPADDPVLNPHGAAPVECHSHGGAHLQGVTRRGVLKLGAAGVMMSALGVGSGVLHQTRASATGVPSVFGPGRRIRMAMHVHGSWSEGPASWEAQFAQAANEVDILCMSDHNTHALAFDYMTSLSGWKFDPDTSGSLISPTATNTGGVVRTVAESNGSAPGVLTYELNPKPDAWNHLRTSIAGQAMVVTFQNKVQIDGESCYEIVVQMSNHPAYGRRPAGQFSLRYRFGNFAHARYVDASGITGIVTYPVPAVGSQVTLVPTDDVSTLWPDMLAIDNSSYNLSMVATSATRGQVVDVSISIQFSRTQNDPTSVTANQKSIISTYGARHPSMAVWPTEEMSPDAEHYIPIGTSQQYWADPTTFDVKNAAAWWRNAIAEVHALGGLTVCAHPLGYSAGALLSADGQVDLRRAVLAKLIANGCYGGGEIIEVYPDRGGSSFQTHLDLADTFSARGIYKTINGANDDHAGLHWLSLGNGLITAVMATSTAPADVVAAFSSGRAYAYHPGHAPSLELDMLLNGDVPMGQVSVSSLGSQALSINATGLPSDSTLELWQGAMNPNAVDPGTSIVHTWPAKSLTGSGTVTVNLNTTTPGFVRPQIRLASGTIVATGNPTWFTTTPTGVPASRIPA